MSLTPLIKKSEIKSAYVALVKSLKSGAVRYRRLLGWRGGSGTFTLYWHPRQQFWVVISVDDLGGYWFPYGTTNPTQCSTTSITCEINPPEESVNRRKGGVFLRDSTNGLFLAHSGKVAGGRKGIGRGAFFESYGGARQEIEWPDGVLSDAVILGKIGGRSFLRNVADYIHAVEDFKANNTDEIPKAVNAKNYDLSFSPEFEGPRRRYVLTEAIESQCDHGTVVNTLREELKALGSEAYRTSKIDLFLVDSNASITHLIEVKTDQTTTSLYQAVGQVLLHGALDKSNPKRILVLPGQISPDTADRMKKLGITVVRYDWKGSTPAFDDLKKALG